MRISFVEIANFRKLLSIRVDLAESTSLFVGANNSGKTSAMLALRKFLSSRKFETRDITLSHWARINATGQRWLDGRSKGTPVDLTLNVWAELLPALDLWFQVDKDEIHRVSHLIPTLEWDGGLLGVRLRLEPKGIETLYKEFLDSITDAEAVKAAARGTSTPEPPVWPSNLVDFLDRKLTDHFTIRAYPLDPERLVAPLQSRAKPQALVSDLLPIDGDPLSGLIRVDEITAQRGFGDALSSDGAGSGANRNGSHRLSDQLRDYYRKHLDPIDRPDPSDIGVLQAIENARNAFDKRLAESFAVAFSEVESMGYPGVTDPRPHVSTRLDPIDGLNHAAAISFAVGVVPEAGGTANPFLLPEDNNGLGYQNLISMIFRLMSFRDAWMRVGKAAKQSDSTPIPAIHLVLVEEPEAHLHAQVQQVFIKKAYQVLRAHKDLVNNKKLATQLVVSTHSSHVAHEIPFSGLRYFRRLPAGMASIVPVSAVVNLSEVFGTESETERFVTRYLRAQHADLFFADGAVLVEGPAERMLIPSFIRAHYSLLSQCYITMLEIGGSHAHRLRPLIEHLGIPTLVITDLDTLNKNGGSSVPPQRGKDQVTNNATLRDWLPEESHADALFDADAAKKVKRYDDLFGVRVAYQYPLNVTRPGATKAEMAYPYTFEDALVFENLEVFSKLPGIGLIRKFREAITTQPDMSAIGAEMFDALKDGRKAEFALDILASDQFETLAVPRYIAEGLAWLEEQLKAKQVDILPATKEGLA